MRPLPEHEISRRGLGLRVETISRRVAVEVEVVRAHSKNNVRIVPGISDYIRGTKQPKCCAEFQAIQSIGVPEAP